MKKYILTLIALLPVLSFAAWSQPTATPPNGNTQPPINVGNIEQYKRGTVGAYEFCLFKSDGTKITPCLGKSTGGATSFPWVYDGATSNIKNTNNVGKINILDTSGVPSFFDQKLNVQGNVQASGFCIGKSCIDASTVGGSVNEIDLWEQIIKKYSGGSGGNSSIPASCLSGQVIKWNGTSNAWSCGNDEYGSGSGTGITGAPGPRGCVGPTGPRGEKGAQGLTGAAGYTPIKGVDFVDGKDGTNGKDGADGKDGIGLPTSCNIIGQIAKWTGSAWVCGTDSTGTASTPLPTGCSAGQVAKWNGSAWNCADDSAGVSGGKPGDTNGDGIVNYNDLPSGAVAGWCHYGHNSYYSGTKLAKPAIATNAGGVMNCSCEAGWSTLVYTSSGTSDTRDWPISCIKN